MLAERQRFVDWLSRQVIADARGDRVVRMEGRPDKRLWLGRLGPEDADWKQRLGERGQRLEPSAAGFRFRPRAWSWTVEASFVVWVREGTGDEAVWAKSPRISVSLPVAVPAEPGRHDLGRGEIVTAVTEQTGTAHRARIEIEVEHQWRGDGLEVTATLVNETPSGLRGIDGCLYETRLAAHVGELDPIALDALPDTFRYDRDVPAVGVYGGVELCDGVLRTTDAVVADRKRPAYWDAQLGGAPDLTFATLQRDPLPSLRALVESHARWGETHWSAARLDARAAVEGWTGEMRQAAVVESGAYASEAERLAAGLRMLETDETVRRAFQLANAAFEHSSRGRYDGWRSFQVGFLLTALPGVVDPSDPRREVVDVLWFATGGGKTETYLFAIVLLCLHDRMTGKQEGISAWSRFPLRMLSLQQTQRFADALAGAELQRREHELGGAPFGMGFLVGGPPSGTPNRVRDDADSGADANDPSMPETHRVLLRCPFCGSDELSMRFRRRTWTLEHRCGNDLCPWPEAALPFWCVDEEIYRFLPSVVVGTLDKAASVALQAAMRGLYDAPWAACPQPGHGFTYAPRKRTRSGCLVPDCPSAEKGERNRLQQARERYAPTLRVQDELHLLRDSLGAIDSHYETLLDHLQRESGGPPAKMLASSATLSGFREQSRELYARDADVFPLQGPAPGRSFWTLDEDVLARRFLGLAPRGQTLEFANDRVAESLQVAVRRALADPVHTAAEIGVAEASIEALALEYGTNVIYGTKIRDVEAAARSFEGQPSVTPLEVAQLTGRTPLTEVLATLERLDRPEPAFEDRLHVICASSMMSHGVDIDRFNTLTMLGLPLSTAEFIQTSARIGRRHPGLVLVLHRMGVERDAGIFRTFRTFVEQGDRLVDPVPITRRSKRVLEHTFAGVFLARVLGLMDRKHHASQGRTLVMADQMRALVANDPAFVDQQLRGLCDALGVDPGGGHPLVDEVRRHLDGLVREIEDPASKARFTNELPAGGAMTSLREVEVQIPVYSDEGRR